MPGSFRWSASQSVVTSTSSRLAIGSPPWRAGERAGACGQGCANSGRARRAEEREGHGAAQAARSRAVARRQGGRPAAELPVPRPIGAQARVVKAAGPSSSRLAPPDADRSHDIGAIISAVQAASLRVVASIGLPGEGGARGDAGHYDNVPEATVAMATDERIHARVLSGLTPSTALSGIRRGERWHRGDSSGALRAAIFGVNDGLVSNLSLVMGVTGGQADRKFILLAGLAGLLAGAFSMGAGEFIS